MVRQIRAAETQRWANLASFVPFFQEFICLTNTELGSFYTASYHWVFCIYQNILQGTVL